MRKIVSILLVTVFLSTNFSLAADKCEGQCGSNETCSSCVRLKEQTLAGDGFWNCTKCDPLPTGDGTNKADCNKGEFGDRNPDTQKCCAKGETVDSSTKTCITAVVPPNNNPDPVMGITCNESLLVNGQCKLNIYDTLGIRKSVRDEGDPTSVGLFVQDIVLSATFFIGTIVTIALVISGIMYIMAASSGKSPDAAKKGIIGSLVGLLIVVSSYVIIRLVQYIAKGF